MILINTLAIAGSLLVGAQVYQKVGGTRVITFWDRLPSQQGRQKVDYWFSAYKGLQFGKDGRPEGLEALSPDSDRAEITEDEQRIDHYLAVSSSSLAVAAVGALIFPPLAFLSVPSLLYNTLPIYQSAYSAIFKERRVRVDIVYASTLTLLLVGQQIVLANMNTTLFFLTEKLLVMARERFKRNVREMFGALPGTVRVLEDGVEVEKALQAVELGEMIVVQAGEVIPLDGIIRQGMASIDQHLLTGESQPVEKERGEAVFASTMVLAGQIYVEVEKTGEQTMVAQIGQILEQTTEFKSSQQFWAEKLTDESVVPMFALAGLSLPFIGSYGAGGILNAHPQRRILSGTPLSTLNFLNLAAQQGILVKDGRTLELFSQVDTVIFDKTGTLTLDQPHVGQLHPCNGQTEESLLRLAAAAERHQSHPIAKAIREAAQAKQLTLPEINESHYYVGYGIRVKLDEQLIQLGSLRFIEREGIPIPPPLRSQIEQAQQNGHSIVFVAVEDQLAGAIELHATIRPEVHEMIQSLQKQGLSLMIISGDHEQPTKKLAQSLGIEHYFAETLPKQKADLIAQLQAEGKMVCFIGDGINDAIALKKAHVSISLRGAATAATDSAHVILMNSELSQLTDFFDLTQQFKRNMISTIMTILAPAAFSIGGAFFLNFGIVQVELIDYASLAMSVGVAMLPRLRYER